MSPAPHQTETTAPSLIPSSSPTEIPHPIPQDPFRMETTNPPPEKHPNRETSQTIPPLKHKHHALPLLLKIPYIIWAITESNFFTFIIPNTCFGVFSALSSSTLLSHAPQPSSPFTPWPGPVPFLTRLALTIFFNWYITLVFDLANQQSTESINEDKINKPWRPIPSGLMTQAQGRVGMLVSIPIVMALCYFQDVWNEGVMILVFTWMYHDPIHGGEEIVVRDTLNGVSYALFNTASLRIMSGAGRGVLSRGEGQGVVELSWKGVTWVGIVGCVIFSTVHVQDLKDQVGDGLRGRRTVALALGDGVARVGLSVCLPFWSVVSLVFWKGSSTMVFYLVGTVVVGSVAVAAITNIWLRKDSMAWKFWCFWTVTLYSLPLLSAVL